ncbi:MAG: sigma-70 family RNA polymerase sigma factor [Flavobacteriales bacterium]|nr:sigma-70 family RNA polymerase sigma factor [Flavobacteriales bacterium]
MTKDQFNICFNKFFDPIRSFIYFRCGDQEVATDIAQDSFMKIWEKNLEYNENQIKGLLYKISKELWISQYRKLDSARKFELNLTYEDERITPEDLLEYDELRVKYEEVLSILPENQREVFLMSRMEDLTYKEIADRLDIGVKAIEKRMSLALRTLRKELKYGK